MVNDYRKGKGKSTLERLHHKDRHRDPERKEKRSHKHANEQRRPSKDRHRDSQSSKSGKRPNSRPKGEESRAAKLVLRRSRNPLLAKPKNIPEPPGKRTSSKINWSALSKKIPWGMDDAAKKERKRLWRLLDMNGNGLASLAEVDKLFVKDLKMSSMIPKCVLMRSFQAAKAINQVYIKIS